MPADRLLTTVLQAYQNPSNGLDTERILSSTTSLLTTLSNPLNISLLTSQLLTAPAIWSHVDSLSTSLRIISIYNTAAITVRNYYLERGDKPYDAYQPRLGGGLNPNNWAKAVVKGADERSPRWMHTLVITGVLLGMEGQERRGLSSAVRVKLEYAIVTAANLSLVDQNSIELGFDSVSLALNHAFPLLSNGARRELDYDSLVMVLMRVMSSTEGYQDAYFLEAIDYDVKQAFGNSFDWSSKSPSFLQVQRLQSKPLVSSIGPLARLIAHAIENVKEPQRAVEVREQLLIFTSNLFSRWERNKLSEVDPSEEVTFLSPDTLRITFPVLWQTLKTAMFATVVILRALIGRTLIDTQLSSPQSAAATATKSLLMLRNIHFISARLGSNTFSAYTFVNLSSIDILTRFPVESAAFLRAIYPTEAGHIPAHPLQRNLDLFYLNTAEHFTLSLSPTDSETLVAVPASPYLNSTANAKLLEIFEAAHSAMLAVLASPQNSRLAAKILPFYVESLFNSFPNNLSPRQFRFAFKSLMQVSTPPSPIAATEPMMAETLLELLHHRALHAPTSPLPPAVAVKSEADAQSLDRAPPLSEQAILLLTLLDALPNVTLKVLEDWLPITANLMNVVQERGMREYCRNRLWELLEGGEMDVERSAICVAWWSTRGGKELVLLGSEGVSGPFMSGALAIRDGSRL